MISTNIWSVSLTRDQRTRDSIQDQRWSFEHTWHLSVRAPPCRRLGRNGRQPALVQPPGELSVDIRSDQGAECMRELNVFALAADRAILGQEAFFHEISKQLRVTAICRTQQVEETLRGCAVLVRKVLLLYRNCRRRQVA